MENSLCAEFGIRAESVRSGGKSPHQECNMTQPGLVLLSFIYLFLGVVVVVVVVALVYLLDGHDPKLSYRVTFTAWLLACLRY